MKATRRLENRIIHFLKIEKYLGKPQILWNLSHTERDLLLLLLRNKWTFSTKIRKKNLKILKRKVNFFFLFRYKEGYNSIFIFILNTWTCLGLFLYSFCLYGFLIFLHLIFNGCVKLATDKFMQISVVHLFSCLIYCSQRLLFEISVYFRDYFNYKRVDNKLFKFVFFLFYS